ncbi:MAG: DEAD/DEAH box helicase [Candidatus Lokiarchaeota archaeon]|nr:DEAD/DEAH box helicase [Candidatus Lokiarchaeota archaeon]
MDIAKTGAFLPVLLEIRTRASRVFRASWQSSWDKLPADILPRLAELTPLSCFSRLPDVDWEHPEMKQVQEFKETHVEQFLNEVINGYIHDVLANRGFIDSLEKFPASENRFKQQFGRELYAFRQKHSLKLYLDWLQDLAWGRGVVIEAEGSSSDVSDAYVQNLHDAVLNFAAWTGQPAAIVDNRPWIPCVVVVPTPAVRKATTTNDEQEGEAETWTAALIVFQNQGSGHVLLASKAWRQYCGTNAGQPGYSHPVCRLILETIAILSRGFDPFNAFLSQALPSAVMLNAKQVFDLATRARHQLECDGIKVHGLDWIGQKKDTGLVIDVDMLDYQPGSLFNASSIMKFNWKIAIGQDTLSLVEFEELVRKKTPLVRYKGKWLEIPETLGMQASRFITEERKDAPLTLGKVLRLGLGKEQVPSGLRVLRIEGNGSARELIHRFTSHASLEPVPLPRAMKGELRPYQHRGVEWLAFLTSYGFGGCLADDMGLGKTVQAITFLLHDRERASANLPGIGAISGGDGSPRTTRTNLVVCPVSVLGNWVREFQKFAPCLKIAIHHGTRRIKDDSFMTYTADHDVIITSYALIQRDAELFMAFQWNAIIIDEAQNIKNDQAKQTRIIKSLISRHKIALTGTPVENRLAELWSIMDFLNPGYLGSVHEFHTTFELPVGRKDEESSVVLENLKHIIHPFILRRVKTDKTLIPELPDKIEVPEYCNITQEQASLYQALVNEMLNKVDEASSPMERRGLILATLVKLKQVCDHPEAYLNAGGRISGRSLKLDRLENLVENVMALNEKCIIFTQFVHMGEILVRFLQEKLRTNILFMHGAIPANQREQMIASFQAGGPESPSIFVLTLKTGGNGLNLTAANHVVHFDRWWNPAVENQATDRTHRIGQSRRVMVYKFIALGTIEEQIDKMIEEKRALAENVIDQGDKWITEMSTTELKRVFALRNDVLQEARPDECTT